MSLAGRLDKAEGQVSRLPPPRPQADIEAEYDRCSEQHPAGQCYRRELARLGLPQPHRLRGIDLIEESIRLAGVRAPRTPKEAERLLNAEVLREAERLGMSEAGLARLAADPALRQWVAKLRTMPDEELRKLINEAREGGHPWSADHLTSPGGRRRPPTSAVGSTNLEVIM